jgi:hypothetical protein
MAPARAGAATRLERILSRISLRSELVKTKPTLPAELSMPAGDAARIQHTTDVGQKALVVWVVGDKALQRTADHGVLSHKDDTLAAERLADLVHLLRRDIVDGDDEDALVLLEEHLELLKVSGLEFFRAPHCVRVDAKGCLRS